MAGALAAADCDRAVEESGDGGTICKVIRSYPHRRGRPDRWRRVSDNHLLR